MRGGCVVVAGLAAGAALVACGCGDDASVRKAMARTRSAAYLVVSQPGGGRLLISPQLLVIERRGRVVAWTRTAYELTWRAKKHCYDRVTDFNHDDLRQVRASVVPAALAAGREDDGEGRGTEYDSTLDDKGRIATVRWRAASFGGEPPGRWYAARYRYPSAAQFASLAGPAPGPRLSLTSGPSGRVRRHRRAH
jgi:hypothetical protein